MNRVAFAATAALLLTLIPNTARADLSGTSFRGIVVLTSAGNEQLVTEARMQFTEVSGELQYSLQLPALLLSTTGEPAQELDLSFISIWFDFRQPGLAFGISVPDFFTTVWGTSFSSFTYRGILFSASP